jgi:hypothetical protein
MTITREQRTRIKRIQEQASLLETLANFSHLNSLLIDSLNSIENHVLILKKELQAKGKSEVSAV